MFSTIYIYNSAEFIELLVSQPVERSQIWTALFLGLGSSQGMVFLVGMGLPLLVFVHESVSLMFLITGFLISWIFCAIGFLAAVYAKDKARGIGIAILAWLFFALLYDGLILFLLYQFSDYPIEKAMVGVVMLSPIDLARILLLLHLDVSALMGFTGAIFKSFFGTISGMVLSFAMLLVWLLVPFSLSLYKFKNKDL
jgi:Cu-processing system permease protein